MNFKDFLKEHRTKNGFASAREQFESLGGEQSLGMSLRNFQLVESGQRPPTEKTLMAIFRKISVNDYKQAILSFFTSHSTSHDSQLLDFLETNLKPAENRNPKGFFEDGRNFMMYTAEQLDFLSSQPDAMRLHHRLNLWEKLSHDELQSQQNIVKKLMELSLAENSLDGIKTSRSYFRVPSFQNSPPSVVRKATQFYKAVFQNYVSEEGSPQQQINFSMQFVTHTLATQILEQVVSLRRWIQSIAVDKPAPGLAPFVFLSFSKKLERHEV